jgi:hypothetical protein
MPNQKHAVDRRNSLKNQIMHPLLEALMQKGVVDVHYMAHKESIVKIATDGIRSRLCLKRSNIKPIEIANSSVLEKRMLRTVDGMNPVCEFVPFYFSWFTAMQKEVESRSIEGSNALVFLDVSVASIAHFARHVWVSSGNASSQFATFIKDPKDLYYTNVDHAQRVKYNTKRTSRVMVRACELLIPTHVPTTCISRVVCKSASVKAWLLENLAGTTHPPISLNPERYFFDQSGYER